MDFTLFDGVIDSVTGTTADAIESAEHWAIQHDDTVFRPIGEWAEATNVDAWRGIGTGAGLAAGVPAGPVAAGITGTLGYHGGEATGHALSSAVHDGAESAADALAKLKAWLR